MAMDSSMSTTMEEADEEFVENAEKNTTYHSISVEEMSFVKYRQPDHWTNKRVRVIGMVKDLDNPVLISVLEEGGPYTVSLDLGYLEKPLPINTVVQVFGVVKINRREDTPYILVRFFRSLQDVDIQAMREVVELQRKYVPHDL